MADPIPYPDVEWTDFQPNQPNREHPQERFWVDDAVSWTDGAEEINHIPTTDFMNTLSSNNAGRFDASTNEVHTTSGYPLTVPSMYGRTNLESINFDNGSTSGPRCPNPRQASVHEMVAQYDMGIERDAFSPENQPQGTLSTIVSLSSPSHEVWQALLSSSQHGPDETQPSMNTSHPPIGVIYSTNEVRKYLIKCSMPRCGKTFHRAYEFDRHYNGAHALKKIVYWCPEIGCKRSDSAGNKPFPRSDKVLDHLRKVHLASDEALEA